LERTSLQPEIVRPQRVVDSPPSSPAALDERPVNGAAMSEGGELHPWVMPLGIDPEVLDEKPIVMPSDLGPAAHAYRMLRTQLLQLARQHRVHAIGIVSAADREGKTVTAINLALSLAVEPNHTVLLVDLDLRRPGIADTLKMAPKYGLESWFGGEIKAIPDITYPVRGFERLFIIPALAGVRGSSELLSAVRTQNMLSELKARDPGRIILFDLPPLLLTDDFLTVASHLDGVIVVAREGRTKREDLTRMSEILGTVRILGTVLNHSEQFERRAY